MNEPLYIDLAHELHRAIDAGEFKGGRLPSQTAIARTHGVARITVSKAIKVLKRRGIVHTTYLGTFVGPQPESNDD